MHRPSVARTVATALVGVLVSGCATQFTNDVELQSVDPVFGHSKGALHPAGWIPSSAPSTREKTELSKDAPPSHLKITFTTRANLPKFAREEAHSVVNDAYFCAQPDEDVRLVASSIYVHGQRNQNTLAWWNDEKADIPIEYSFFLNLNGQKEETRHFTFHAFDLVNEPRDVCSILRGGHYLDLGYESNTVAIPKAMIETALHGVPSASQ